MTRTTAVTKTAQPDPRTAVLTAALRQLRDQVTAQFVARAEMVEAVLTALVAGEHVFVYGPPGTAKSSVLRSLASGFGGKFFRIVLNPDITREDVIGPLDPAAVRNGQWRRKIGCFAAADLAFLDEIWKASPQVANMLLDGLEERLITDGDQDFPIPLISAVAASNEVPDDKALRAAYDRFGHAATDGSFGGGAGGFTGFGSGGLGDIFEVKAWDYDHFVGGVRSPADCDPPKGLDWDFYVGPAPMRPYNPLVHPRSWRAFMEYGNGIIGDMCVHMLDTTRWWYKRGVSGFRLDAVDT